MHAYKYKFELDDGAVKEFAVALDDKTLNIIPTAKEKPDWTLLNFFQCPGCKLSIADTAHCPIAVNIAGLVGEFKEAVSAQQARVTVESEDRSVAKTTGLAEGLYSLLGVYMAASGCPAMDGLKPMAAHHLPFSNIDETVYRVMTMYLAAQYFRMKEGLRPDWELKNLVEMYEAIRNVNTGFAERLRRAAEKDAILNSLVNLDVFAMTVLDAPGNINSLKYLFSPYLAK